MLGAGCEGFSVVGSSAQTAGAAWLAAGMV